ncbi:MAG: hypothetical protein MUP81_06280 [Dehalococcoidia bacterium]|nr:hypothetical protein [Dehalococcoidia bacterium]
MKDLYFTVIVCDKCKQGSGTFRKVDGKYIHVKCPSKMRTVMAKELKALQNANR